MLKTETNLLHLLTIKLRVGVGRDIYLVLKTTTNLIHLARVKPFRVRVNRDVNSMLKTATNLTHNPLRLHIVKLLGHPNHLSFLPEDSSCRHPPAGKKARVFKRRESLYRRARLLPPQQGHPPSQGLGVPRGRQRRLLLVFEKNKPVNWEDAESNAQVQMHLSNYWEYSPDDEGLD